MLLMDFSQHLNFSPIKLRYFSKCQIRQIKQNSTKFETFVRGCGLCSCSTIIYSLISMKLNKLKSTKLNKLQIKSTKLDETKLKSSFQVVIKLTKCFPVLLFYDGAQ